MAKKNLEEELSPEELEDLENGIVPLDRMVNNAAKEFYQGNQTSNYNLSQDETLESYKEFNE